MGNTQENQIPIKRFFTIREAATYLGRGVYGVRTLIWNGKLPVIRDGRKMFVDKEDLDAYMLSLKQGYSLREQDERPGKGKR